MLSFREYIKQCVADDKDILVEVEHLDSVTYDDICALIYLISDKYKKVILSKNAKKKLNHNNYDRHFLKLVLDYKNCEELGILVYLSFDYHDILPILIYRDDQLHKMSTDFVLYAESFAMQNYRMVMNIMASFDIRLEPDHEQAEKCFDIYLNYN
jgi:hypothetical protein